jgi:hypothetical protein
VKAPTGAPDFGRRGTKATDAVAEKSRRNVVGQSQEALRVVFRKVNRLDAAEGERDFGIPHDDGDQARVSFSRIVRFIENPT